MEVSVSINYGEGICVWLRVPILDSQYPRFVVGLQFGSCWVYCEGWSKMSILVGDMNISKECVLANIASQRKRNRQNVSRQDRNKAVRSEIKTRTKQVLNSQGEAAAASFREAQKRIDVAVSKGILHKKTAARQKSRLARRISHK